MTASNSQRHSGTRLFEAIAEVNRRGQYDRLIVITDEQAHASYRYSRVPDPTGIGYMVNVASNANGVGYGDKWTHVDGFSEGVLRYIMASENGRGPAD